MKNRLETPIGWKKVFIPEVLFFQEGPGVRNWQFRDKGVKLLNVGNINNQELDLSSTKLHLDEEEANGKYSHFLLNAGELVIGCSGIVVENFHNKIAFVSARDLPLCLNTSTMRFRPLNDKVSLNYFRYFLQTNFFKKQLQRLITGSAQLNFGPSHIKQIELLLPPLPTQQKIAAVLDKANAIRKRSQQILAKYDQLAQSVFLEMFGDPVKNEKGWEMKTLNQIFSIKHGYAFKSEYFCESSPYTLLTPGNFFEKGGYRDQGKKQKFYCGDFSKEYLLTVGDLLIAMTEQTEGLLGSCFIVPSNGLFLHNQRLGKVILKERMNKVFLSFIYNNSSVRKIIQNSSTGTKVKHTSPTKLTDIEIGFPPISLQNQFATIITQIEKQKAQTQLELNRAEDLYQSLLQRAFTGELFPEPNQKELTVAP